MEFKTVTVPPGGYDESRIIYAFKFSDGSVYVGITGTSNRTGVSKPLRRLATHLRKSGNTFSILDRNEQLANKGFRFTYVPFDESLAECAEAVEQQCRQLLRKRSVTLLNGDETHDVKFPEDSRQAITEMAHGFVDHVQRLPSDC